MSCFAYQNDRIASLFDTLQNSKIKVSMIKDPTHSDVV